MSNTMTAHEPINYLDSILNEEEKRCEYSHQWRNFTISRSGRFKSKNKHRNVVDGKMFDHTTTSSSTTTGTTSSASGISTTTSSSSAAAGANIMSSAFKTSSSSDKDKKISSHYGSFGSTSAKSYQNQTKSISSSSSSSMTNTRQRDKVETYKSYYETNL